MHMGGRKVEMKYGTRAKGQSPRRSQPPQRPHRQITGTGTELSRIIREGEAVGEKEGETAWTTGPGQPQMRGTPGEEGGP